MELQYRKPFNEVWDEENGDPILGPLSERMGVRGRDRGPLLIRDEEMEAASKSHTLDSFTILPILTCVFFRLLSCILLLQGLEVVA